MIQTQARKCEFKGKSKAVVIKFPDKENEFMALPAFDTLKVANRLKAVGVPSAQAEAEAEVLSEIFEVKSQALVSKEDLRATKEDLRREIGDVRQEISDVRREINDLRKDMDAKFANVDAKFVFMEERSDAKYESLRKDMDAKFVSMDAKFDVLRAELAAIKWGLGIIGAGTVAILVKTFF